MLVDADGAPVLIGIEGAMHFDAEWEHVFPRIRLPEPGSSSAHRRSGSH
ncbi:hypothetical protein [Streptomyces sp. CBMA156]|nr:hypothetical protein [Streptomyces sp. CBMA156]